MTNGKGKQVDLDKIASQVGKVDLNPTAKAVVTDVLKGKKEKGSTVCYTYGGGTGIVAIK